MEVVSPFEKTKAFKKNEIRLNILEFSYRPAVNLYYERIIDESNGYGVSLFVNFDDNKDTSRKFSIGPYYRLYFLNRKDYGAGGGYLEVFTSFSSVNYREGLSKIYKERDEFQISMGVTVGNKEINKKGYSLECFLGLGRYLLKKDFEGIFSPENYLLVGISLGKRF